MSEETFKTIIFPLVEKPAVDFKQYRKKLKIRIPVFLFSILLVAISFVVFSIYLSFLILIIASIIWIRIDITNSLDEKVYEILHIGFLEVSSEGLRGYKKDETNLFRYSYSEIQQLSFEYDRPDISFGKYRPPRTYKICVVKGNKTEIVYVERLPILANRQIYKNYLQTMNALSKVSQSLYKKIKYIDSYMYDANA